MRVSEVTPFLYSTPLRPKRKKDEPVNFCGYFQELMLIQRRNLMLQQMLRWWSYLTGSVGKRANKGIERLDRII